MEERLAGETSEKAVGRVQVRVALGEIAGHPVAFAELSVLWLGRMLLDVGNGLLYFSEFYEASALTRASWLDLAGGEIQTTLDALEAVWHSHARWVGVVIVGFCGVYLVALVALYALAGIGAWRWIVGDGKMVGLLLVLTVLYLAVLPGPLGELRFRVPFMPYLVLLAAAAKGFTRT